MEPLARSQWLGRHAADCCQPTTFFNTTPHAFAGKILSMKVTLGVSGGIAAYKAAELLRALQQQALEAAAEADAEAQTP